MNHQKLGFVVGGAQKSGTSTLHRLLRVHGGVQMARIKETHFFDDEGRDWLHPNYDDFEAMFDPPDGRLRGEATPITLYWRPAIRRLRDYNPALKLVFILRNPVERAFSNWRMERRRGRETRSFSDAIAARDEDARKNAEVGGLHRYTSYLDRGLYHAQLAYVREHFPSASIHCEIFEEFHTDRTAGLARVSAFLGIAPFPANLKRYHVGRHDGSSVDEMSEADKAFLAAFYRNDIAKLEAWLGRTIPAWHEGRD